MTAGGFWVLVGLAGIALAGWPAAVLVGVGLALLWRAGKPKA